ncbi:MAG: hypothetical protein IK990_18070 [Ruminiclostridium sp.]|nr:hypothetical protein [Ruminiclostridium sp.]
MVTEVQKSAYFTRHSLCAILITTGKKGVQENMIPPSCGGKKQVSGCFTAGTFVLLGCREGEYSEAKPGMMDER